MGMYTGLNLKAKLDIYSLVEDKKLELLEYMLIPFGEKPEAIPELPNYPLFKSSRWPSMFFGTSAYLEPEFEPESTLKGDLLEVCFNIKNYDNEIQLFLDWISPYVLEFSGIYQYEEMDHPIPLIKNELGRIIPDHKQDKTDYGYW